jgi:hypothetical protein
VQQWRPFATGVAAELVSTTGERVLLDLAVDGHYRIRGRRGDSVVAVADGRVRFIESPCRHQVCIAAGWLDTDGDFAACAPNGVALQVRGPGERYDGISY